MCRSVTSRPNGLLTNIFTEPIHVLYAQRHQCAEQREMLKASDLPHHRGRPDPPTQSQSGQPAWAKHQSSQFNQSDV